MALPTLDATFASSADLPRRQMLAKWLVEELGETQAPSSVLVSGAGSSEANGTYTYRGEFGGKPYYNLVGALDDLDRKSIVWDGASDWFITDEYTNILYRAIENVEFPWLATNWSISDGESPAPTVTEIPQPSPLSNYYSLPERYLWAKIAVAAGAPRGEADYISLPKNYAWSDIYNAVAGSSGNHTDWSENVALGHIAAAYRGDTANPANLATYIDWPWRYKVASIIGGIGPAFPSNGLLAFWKLDDLTDSSGNGNTLTNNSGATFSSGHIGNAVDIYQTEILSINGMTTIPWATAASLSGWYNTSTVQDGELSLFFGKETGFAVGYRSNNVLTIFDYAGGEVYTSGSVVQNTWQHIVITTNNSDMLVYLNGSLLGTYSNILSNISGLTIGDSTYRWNGQADAVGVWSRALTQQEVGALYNGGSGIEP